MTTPEKLEHFQKKTGRTWIDIASILGVSRQMINAVRSGTRNLSPPLIVKLDNLLSSLPASGLIPSEPVTSLAGLWVSIGHRLDAIENSVKEVGDQVERLARSGDAHAAEIAYLREQLAKALDRIPKGDKQ